MNKPVPCKSCKRLIIWVKMQDSNKKMPIDYDSINKLIVMDSTLSKGAVRNVGISHFSTCPNADNHRIKEKVICHVCGKKDIKKYFHHEIVGGLIKKYTCFICSPITPQRKK